MKKKLLCILTAIMAVLSCVFVSACGNKYENLKFKILYSVSEDATEWYDATQGLSLNYEIDENNNLKLTNGGSSIYFKVQIQNVSSKDVDSVTVTSTQSSGINFSSTRVKQNKVFEIPIIGNVNTSLKFYENNSKKSHTINFEIFRKLESIDVDTSIKPAITIGSTLNLRNIQNLTYQPSFPPAFRTNQTGVKYTVESIGRYAGHAQDDYIANNSFAPENYVRITDGVMEIIDGTFLSQSAYVIRVKATSIYHDGSEDESDVISALFDVFVVEANNSAYMPTAYFVEDGERTTVEVGEINIYGGNEKFSSSVIDLSSANLASVYKDERYAIGSSLKYEEYIEVLDKTTNKYVRLNFDDASTTEDIGGLLVSYISDGRYKLSVANLTDKTNKIKIGYEIAGLDFGGTQKPVFEKVLTVNKGLLPSEISLNDSDENSGNIYVSSNYKGYAINVKAVPNDGTERQISIKDENSSFIISDVNGLLTNYTTSYGTTTYTVSNNTTLYVKFKENVSYTAQKLIFSTSKSPSIYNGRIPATDPLSREFTFYKKVTADKIEFVKDKNGAELDGLINLNATDVSYMYIKLTYRATEQGPLNEDTITLKSKNSNIKFSNGSNEIELNRDMYVYNSTVTTVDEDDSIFSTSIYQIPFAATNSIQTGEVLVEAGKGSIGVSAYHSVKTVYLMNNKNIKIVENNNSVKLFTTRDNAELDSDNFYFAVERGTFVEFEVLDGNDNSNTIQNIKLEKISDLGNNYFTTIMNPTVLQPNIFTMTASGTQTQVMKLSISYYTKDSNDDIVLETEERQVEIAVFNPISNITLTASKIKMANFEGYNNSAVSYNAFASSISSQITSSIYFTKLDSDKKVIRDLENNVVPVEIGGVNALQISFDGVNLQNESDMIVLTDSSNNTIESAFRTGNLSGVINIDLIDDILSSGRGIDNLKIIVQSISFGAVTNVYNDVVIKFAEIDEAKRIVVSGADIVKYSDDNHEVQMSFMKTQEDYVETTINATLQFDSLPNENKIRLSTAEQALDYELYEYQLDENGDTIYVDGVAQFDQISKNRFDILFSGNRITIKSHKDLGGGLFRLVLKAKGYDLSLALDVRISDGQTVKYIVKTAEEFMMINNDLTAGYVLGNNIAITINGSVDDKGVEHCPIGYTNSGDAKVVSAFLGKLSGELKTNNQSTSSQSVQRYTLKLTVSDYLDYDIEVINQVGGLFTILGSGAEISNLTVNVEFGTSYTNGQTLHFGSLAGIALEGSVIKNVVVNISQTSSETSSNKISFMGSGDVNFGGIVGKNEGEIINCKVNCNNQIIITSNTTSTKNIGLIAGLNGTTGEISGYYESKDSLNSLSFDVVANILIENENVVENAQVKYEIGGVAGSNLGTINNVIVGGKINVKKQTSNEYENVGGLGGIAGSNSGEIQNVIAFAVNLSDDTGLDVGGVTATGNGTITKAKYVSAIVKFYQFTVNGQINGTKNVAGIIAEATGGSITLCGVESFVNTIYDEAENKTYTFFTVNSGNKVGAIYALNSGASVSRSFVSANINANVTVGDNNCYFYGTNLDLNGNEVFKYEYKLTGETVDFVVGVKATESNKLTLDANIDNLYIKDATGKFVKTNEGSVTLGTIYYTINLSGIESFEATNWDKQEGYNVIFVENVEYNLPYLLDDDGLALMILAPTEIKADINEEYVVETLQSVYTNLFRLTDKNVTETAIINYHYVNGKPTLEHNTYNLFTYKYTDYDTAVETTIEGLANLTIVPADATGGVVVELVGSSYRYANIKQGIYGYEITFTGISWGTPIIVRCYSVFNPEIEEYFVFYTQAGLSDLMLVSNDIVNVNAVDYKYELSMFGSNESVLQLDAQNLYGGNYFVSLLEIDGIESYLKLDATFANDLDSFDYVNINTDRLNNITMSLKDNLDFDGNMKEGVLTFTLKLNANAYFDVGDEHRFAENTYIDLGSVKVNVQVFKSATNVEIDGSDSEITTADAFEFGVDLSTGFVDDSKAENEENIFIIKGNADGIIIELEVVEGEEELNKLLTTNNITEIAQLFNCHAPSTLKEYTYHYDIRLEFNNEFSYRYITNNIKFNVKVSAFSNPEIYDSIYVTFKPTSVSTTRIANYAINGFKQNTDYTNIVSYAEETSIISPAGLGTLFMIFVEPNYANVDKVTLTSSSLYVPSLGKNVILNFTQMVYHNKKLETIYGNDAKQQVGDTLELSLVSRIENGKAVYDGIIYVHVQIENFSGLEATISATLNVTSNGEELEPYTKPLLTAYIPGATFTYSGEKIDNTANEYIIQQGTYGNKAQIKVYGYQFNSNPAISLAWALTNNKSYKYQPSDTYTITSSEDFGNRNLWYIDDDGNYFKTNVYVNGVNTYYDFDERFIQKEIDGETKTYDVRNYVNTYIETDYDKITYNATDDSYTLNVSFNISNDIMAAFSVRANLSLVTKDGKLTTSQDKDVVFHPTKYLINSATLFGLANNTKKIAVRRTSSLQFVFKTAKEDDELTISDELYKQLIEDYTEDDVLNENELKKLFKYTKDNVEKDFSIKVDEFEITKSNSNVFGILANAVFNSTVTFTVSYAYKLNDAGVYDFHFRSKDGDDISKSLQFSFILDIFVSDSEDNATPIYSADQLFNADGSVNREYIVEGGHYILMNDIEIQLASPIDVAIGSFDGNNKTISIKEFVINPSSSHYGLFAQIGTYTDEANETHATLLKNVIVDYSKYVNENVENSTNKNGVIALTNNNITEIVFGGLVGENNGGLIYNCDVMNIGSAYKEINILVDNSSDVNVVFGGLVGINNGIITNSRVGRTAYTQITNEKGNSHKVNASPISFVIGNSTVANNVDSNGFNVVAGGFVGRNEQNGNISSSFVVNFGLINYSTSQIENKTAGFVGENNGKISFAYVKALEDTITSTNPYSTSNNAYPVKIANKGNGMVAGFVYENKGVIDNSFANTELSTQSAYIAGFVFNNASQATIKESYSACTMNSGFSGQEADYAEQPFVGLNNSGTMLSYGKLENCFYLLVSDNYYNEAEAVNKDKDLAKGINASTFRDSENLTGFAFVLSNSRIERTQGIWSYYSTNSNIRILPELTNANTIAYSNKYVLSDNDSKYIYGETMGYESGTANNPYIIRNTDDYTKVFVTNGVSTNGKTTQNGYVRFINNISFSSDDTAIQTRVNYVLGDSSNISTTSIEGNGMTISGIYLESSPEDESVGLFAEIQNTYIKNLNLEFVYPAETDGMFSTLTTKYSGGLAGKISDSILINISLAGQQTTITGKNFVGGVAGLITGKSMLYGITSALSVKTDSNSEALYANSNTDNVSYAGGIAGVLDLETKVGNKNNVAYVEIGGDSRQAVNVSAVYAGGIAGYANKNVSALKLKFNVLGSDHIVGGSVAGGIFGIFAGSIEASQVSAIESTQYEYDKAFGEFILGKSNLNTENIGNKNLISSSNIASGFIGVAVDANIAACYSKASIDSGEIIGGLIGVSIASNVTYSYAVPYINLSTSMKNVGGLIGEVYGYLSNTNAIARKNKYNSIQKYIRFVDNNITSSRKETDVQFTFSSVMLDKVQLDEIRNSGTGNNIVLDYISADYDKDISTFTSNGSKKFSYVFAGLVGGYNPIVETTESKPLVKNSLEDYAAKVELEQLFDFSNAEAVARQTYQFNRVFSSWSANKYWTLDETKFYPLLLNKSVTSYIEITSAEELKTYLSANPAGNYKIMNDINLGEVGDNWVVNSSTPFSGTLIGELQADNKRPKIWGIQLNPSSDDTSGFFRHTNGATISSIEFVYAERTYEVGDYTMQGAINLNSHAITDVAGVSCSDTGSLFINLQVSVADNYPTSLKDSYGYLLNNGDISSFGGIVAKGKGTSINGCTFFGAVNANLSRGDSNYFGGIIADARELQNNDDDEIKPSTILNSSVGISGEDTALSKTKFDLTVAESSQAYIGGAVGNINESILAAISVGGMGYNEGFKEVDINVDFNKFDSAYLGGLVGKSESTDEVSCDAVTNITIIGNGNKKSETATPAQSLNIGGLVGYAGSSGGGSADSIADIELCNSKTTIDLTGLSLTDGLNISAGVGIIEVSQNFSIKQCLFNGVINSEKEDGNLAALNIVNAGGAVAYASNNNLLTLEEVMTNVDITIGTIKEATLCVAGLVANASSQVSIINCATTGKLVPITTIIPNNNDTGLAVYAGGMIGEYEGEVSVNNSFSISSLITDGLVGAYENYHINALFGGSKNTSGELKTVEKVCYSSDYALVPESSEKGHNISGYAMAKTDSWYKPGKYFNIGGAWAELNSTFPYLVALYDSLNSYGILQNNNYIEGTALKPESIINSTEFNSDFTYYIADGLYSRSSVLNGILIYNDKLDEHGDDNGYRLNAFTLQTAGTGANVTKGIIGEIGKHSAVSNLHIFINSSLQNGNEVGIIAGINNGVISNCSVQGYNINASLVSNLGLIAYQNNGLVEYSYSTAELTSGASSSTGGIVNENSGKIVSCYFTGYIEGAGNGIICDNKTNGYAYNNYMAGVVTTISGENAFYGSGTLTGSNNYLDFYSNLTKSNNSELSGVVQTSRNNLNLFKNNDALVGNWYSIFESETIDINSTTFGYNYGYPVHRFNKMYCDDDTLNLADILYQSYTGNGQPGKDTSTDKVESPTVRTSNNVFNNYNDAYKIPHLGVLKSVGEFMNGGADLNYVIIYDINGNDVIWEASNFSGVIVSDKYYNKSENVGNSSNWCTISGLSDKGLFNITGEAYISHIKLGDFSALDSSGALGTAVNAQGTDNEGNPITLKTIVTEIEFLDDAIIAGNNVGALFGTVNSRLEVNSFEFSGTIQGSTAGGLFNNINADVILNNLNLDGNVKGSEIGAIAYSMAGGKLLIKRDDNEKVIQPTFGNDAGSVTLAGGLIAKMSGGTITFNDDIKLELKDLQGEFDTYGAVVGETTAQTDTTTENPKDNANKTISNVNVNVIATSNLKVKNFGFIGTVAGNVTLENCGFVDGDKIQFNKDAPGMYGVLAAEIKADDDGLTVHNFTCDLETITITTSSSKTSQGIGSLVGCMTSGTLTIGSLEKEGFILSNKGLKLNATDLSDVGGLAGQYKGGVFAIYKEIVDTSDESTKKITISGRTNVGGLFGHGNISTEISDIMLSEANGGVDYFNNPFASIKLENKNNNTDPFKNIGGVFGLLNISKDKDNNKLTLTSDITNSNAITIGEGINKDANGIVTDTAINIGGIAGSVTGEGTISGDLINRASISGIDTADILKADSRIKSINVGGIFGSLSGDVEVTSVMAGGRVSGYQNVGGLIGYLDQGSAKIDNRSSSSGVAGVINVGGLVGAVANATSINGSAGGEIIGNVNVGGLVGLALSEIEISGTVTTKDENSNVKGIYFTYTNQDGEAEHCLPTSVGGIIGRAQGAVTLSGITMSGYVTSGEEGNNPISTISNRMFDVDSASTSLLGPTTSKIIDFNNSMNTGFGGLIGTVTTAPTIESATLEDVKVEAQLGINVGLIYGAYQTGVENLGSISLKNTGTVEEPEHHSVSGAYNIGGLIGFVGGAVNGLSNESVGKTGDINPTIVVQENGLGMMVGGLIGRAKEGNVSGVYINNTESNVNIKLCSNGSYYVGGLVGCWNPSSGGQSFGVADGINIVPGNVLYNHDDVNQDDVNQVGGLIGLLRFTSAGELTVQGSHTFPFTVNTIQNSNYADGASTFSYDDSPTEVYLLAEAYYINRDSFNIVGSADGSLYDNDKDCNPLLGDTASWGWSKEYTGFKVMQRIIPQDNIWESLGTVYDATFVTQVGTIANLGMSGNTFNIHQTDWKIFKDHDYLSVDGTKNNGRYEGVKFRPEYIVYTIYEKNSDTPVIYTSSGIGQKIGVKGEDYKNSGKYRDNQSKPYTLKEYAVGKYGNVKFPNNDADFRKEWGVREIPSDGNFLVYIEWDRQVSYKDENQDENSGVSGHDKNFLASTGSGGSTVWFTACELFYCVNKPPYNNIYFDFEVVYGNSTTTGVGNKVLEDNGNLSPSGSVFEITGINPDFRSQNWDSVHTDDTWKTVLIIVGAVLIIGAWIASNIVTGGAANAVWLPAFKTAMAIATATGGFLLYGALAQDWGVVSTSKNISNKTYFELANRNFGLLTSATTSRVNYTYGEFDSEMGEKLIVKDGDETLSYTFYSYNRPSDYYSSYYYYGETSQPFLSYGTDGISKKYNCDLVYIYNPPEHVGDGKTIYQKYYFYNGAYYYYDFSSEVGIYRVQDFMENLNDDTGTKTYNNGNIYVYGGYDGNSGYTFERTFDNMIEKSGNPSTGYTYSLNGYTIEDVDSISTDVGCTFYKSDFTGAPLSYVEGYDYLKGMYYSIKGNGKGQIGKYAKFKPCDTDEDVNGITVVEGYGYYLNSSGTIVYINGLYYDLNDYTFYDQNGEIWTSGNKYIEINEGEYTLVPYNRYKQYSKLKLENVAIQDNEFDDGISIKVYPHSSWDNPYKSYSGYNESYFKDNAIYINTKSKWATEGTTTDKTKTTIQTVRYYSFEGGYNTDISLGLSTGRAESVYTSVYDNATILIYKYNSGSNKYESEYVIASELKADLGRDSSDPNFKNYKNYYIMDMEGVDNASDYTVAKWYKTQGNKLYQKSSNYFIGDGETRYGGVLAKAGLVYRTYTYNKTSDEKAFMRNKYLTNKDWQVYTQFVYYDSDGPLDLTRGSKDTRPIMWDTKKNSSDVNVDYCFWGDYYLIPENYSGSKETFNGSPNYKTTYFIDSARVTLGGGVTLTKTGRSNATSGTITIS